MCERRDCIISSHLILMPKYVRIILSVPGSYEPHSDMNPCTILSFETLYPMAQRGNALESLEDKFRHTFRQNIQAAAWYVIKMPLVGTIGSNNSEGNLTFPSRKPILSTGPLSKVKQ